MKKPIGRRQPDCQKVTRELCQIVRRRHLEMTSDFSYVITARTAKTIARRAGIKLPEAGKTKDLCLWRYGGRGSAEPVTIKAFNKHKNSRYEVEFYDYPDCSKIPRKSGSLTGACGCTGARKKKK